MMNHNKTNPDNEISEQSNQKSRNACGFCRRAKLRCDGAFPACSRCSRLGHECSYDEGRKKSGPKRGHVKSLEARIEQLESLLENQTLQHGRSLDRSSAEASDMILNVDASQDQWPTTTCEPASTVESEVNFTTEMMDVQTHFEGIPDTSTNDTLFEDNFSWDMIELGLDEPLPLPQVLDELTRIYFERIHPSIPMIHQYRYLAAMSLSPQARPPIALRYAMWTLAASVTPKYKSLEEHFYDRARKYAESAEKIGHGRKIQTVPFVQAEILIAYYEFKMMHFPRAWLRTGRAVRLAQMMSLHRLDSPALEVKHCLLTSVDWLEMEERRRTFWIAFCIDRYATIGSGWPTIIDERDILTNLPCSDPDYILGNETRTPSLSSATDFSSAAHLSSLAGVIVITNIFGRVLTHLHRPTPTDNEASLVGDFWTRHRSIDDTLLNVSLWIPPHLKLPQGVADPNVIFLNMCLHAATICLNQVAIFKAEKNGHVEVVNNANLRCLTAASEVVNVMRLVAHLDLAVLNLFTPFTLFVAARILIIHLRNHLHSSNPTTASHHPPPPELSNLQSSIQFLLHALSAMTLTNPMADSFLVQLELELEGVNVSFDLRLREPLYDPEASLEDCVHGRPWARIVSPLVEIVDTSERGTGGRGMGEEEEEDGKKGDTEGGDEKDKTKGKTNVKTNARLAHLGILNSVI